jgi:hypothetical protein
MSGLLIREHAVRVDRLEYAQQSPTGDGDSVERNGRGERRHRLLEGLSDRVMRRVAIRRTCLALLALSALNLALWAAGVLTVGEALSWTSFVTLFVVGSFVRQVGDERRSRK